MAIKPDIDRTPEPHYIPGYTGYCPRLLYRCGKTYAKLTHLSFLDPCASHGQNLLITNRKFYNNGQEKPKLNELNNLKKREKRMDPVYTSTMLPGYKGFVPRVRGKFGSRFNVAVVEGISEFETNLMRKRHEQQKMKVKPALRLRKTLNSDVEAIKNTGNNQKLCPCIENKETSTRIMDKYNNLFDNNEWVPMLPKGIGVRALSNNEKFKIYFEDRGLVPGYTGYVPGAKQKYGETFGKISTDAKQATYCKCN